MNIPAAGFRERWRRADLFRGCSDSEWRALVPHLRARARRRYEVLYREGEAAALAHLVVRGDVMLEKETGAEAEPFRLAVVRAGEAFGIGEMFLPHYVSTATTLTACELLEIPRAVFRDRLLAVPAVRERIMTSLCEINSYLLFRVVAGSALTLLALYLHQMAHRYGRRQGGRLRIQRRVQQPEVASLLHLSREHVSRLFAHLRRQGVVQFNRGYPLVDEAWLQRTVRNPELADAIQYRDVSRPG